MTGFNNKWDQGGELANESNEETGFCGGAQPPTYMERPYTHRVKLTSHAREKREKMQ